MNSGLIATRYATALFEYTKGEKEHKSIYEEAKKINSAFIKYKEFQSVLQNPILPKKDKKQIIVSAIESDVSKHLDTFLELLLKNNREIFLQSIMLKYIDLYRKNENIHFGKFITAMKIDDSVEKNLISMVERQTGGSVEIEKIIEPAIIGGFMFEVDFNRWDASVKNQLNIIRSEYLDKHKTSR